MNEKTHADDINTEQNEAQGSTSAKKTSIRSEYNSKWKEKKTGPQTKSAAENAFCEPLKINMSIFDIGALYSGVKSLFKAARKLDTQVAIYMEDLYTRVSDYFKNAIELYEEKK